jgi:heme exporter protein A
MQQRLAIARAILHEPDVMLFDEPHTGLDPEAAAMLDGVLSQVAARGRTVVMTSHDLGRAAELATRIDILSKGVIARSVRRGEVEGEALPALYRSVTHA